MSHVLARPSVEEIRAQFPALLNGFGFLENAGGSQVPRCVVDAIREYMASSYVQLGAGYPASIRATDLIEEAREFGRVLVNGAEDGKVIFGGSSSALIQMLANAYADVLVAGDEVVIAEMGHEANIGAWFKLERMGVKVRVWKVNPATFESSLDDLKCLLNERSKIVAATHVSNLLGNIEDIAEITRLAHEVGAKVVVDGVAYAPHRAIDVQKWGCDWYGFSAYKVYGPHLGVLYGTAEAAAELNGPNHFFIPKGTPYKFELGCLPHELCAGFLAVGEYLAFLAGRPSLDRSAVVEAFEYMAKLELPLQERLISFLLSKSTVKIIGPAHGESSRVGTISFVHEQLTPQEIVASVDSSGIGIRYGHMYAHRLCEALGLDLESGVVRVSLVHYNTLEEIDRLISVLDGVL